MQKGEFSSPVAWVCPNVILLFINKDYRLLVLVYNDFGE